MISASPSVRAKVMAPSWPQLRSSLRVARTNPANRAPSTGRPRSTSTRTVCTSPRPGRRTEPGTTSNSPLPVCATVRRWIPAARSAGVGASGSAAADVGGGVDGEEGRVTGRDGSRPAGSAGSTVPVRGRLTASAPTGCSTLGGRRSTTTAAPPNTAATRAPRDGCRAGTWRSLHGRRPRPGRAGPRTRPGQDSTASGLSAGSASSAGWRAAGLRVHRRLLGDVVDVLLGLPVELLALVLVHVEVLALLALHAAVLPPAAR